MADLIYLDTHVVIWLYAGNLDLFSPRIQRDLEENTLLISPIVTLEVQYLHEIGRITAEAGEVIDELRRAIDLQISDTPFSQVVAQALRNTWTRDPFDHIITAQAALGQHRLLTKDRTIRDHYDRAYWE
ncbi:MAG: PIN domain-containing protein [Gemmatimonadetes bacterium]|jgi:PIN domain nuclease of toxin-antitoxin system|nr:PIN domain-containing protein [Gemmatimonadota bacterium]